MKFSAKFGRFSKYNFWAFGHVHELVVKIVISKMNQKTVFWQ